MTARVDGSSGPLRRAFKRLVTDSHELEDERLAETARSDGAVPISDCTDRSPVVVTGRIRSLTVRPQQQGSPSLEAELYDGSGAVTLIWLGRRSVAGVRPGALLRAHGRICQVSDRRTLFNPRYDLLPED